MRPLLECPCDVTAERDIVGSTAEEDEDEDEGGFEVGAVDTVADDVSVLLLEEAVEEGVAAGAPLCNTTACETWKTPVPVFMFAPGPACWMVRT